MEVLWVLVFIKIKNDSLLEHLTNDNYNSLVNIFLIKQRVVEKVGNFFTHFL